MSSSSNRTKKPLDRILAQLQESDVVYHYSCDYRYTLRQLVKIDMPPCVQCSDAVIEFCGRNNYECRRYEIYKNRKSTKQE